VKTEIIFKIVVYLSERPPKTIVTYFNAVKQFLEINKIVLTPEHLPEIEVRSIYTKSNKLRIVYISQEAKRTLEEWLKERKVSAKEKVKIRIKRKVNHPSLTQGASPVPS